MLNNNEFEFSFISNTEDYKLLNEEIRKIAIEGAIQLFERSEVPTDGKQVDIKANIINKKYLDNGDIEYLVSVELSNITEEAEFTE